MTKNSRRSTVPLFVPLLTCFAVGLAACGGGGGIAPTPGGGNNGGGNNGGGNNGGGNNGGGNNGGGNNGGQRPANLEASLNQLGVTTTATPRQVAPGVEVPSTYLPLGPKPPLNKTSELLMFGIGLNSPALNNPAIVLELTGANGAAVATVMHAETAANMPFAAETRNMNALPGTLRAPVAGDFDGDGLEEMAVVFNRNNETRVRKIEDSTGAFVGAELLFQRDTLVTNVAAATGDLDGDGDDELIVGLVKAGNMILRVYRWENNTFALAATEKSWTPLLGSANVGFDFAVGNLDLDRGAELAFAISETQFSTGRARWAVLDDLATDLAILRQSAFEGRDAQNTLHAPFTADVAIGDFDGDLVGEVIVGGVTNFGAQCDPVNYFVQMQDDALHGVAAVSGHSFQDFPSGCGSGAERRVRFAHVNAVELDGDPFPEFLVNDRIFDDFRQTPWNARWSLPGSVLWNGGQGWFERNTATMAIGDFTGDSREDIAVYRQDRSFVEVYGLPATATGITRTRNIAVPDHNAQTPINPVLVAANVDTDSPVLKYSEASYRLIYSEPIVLAALAAPPARQGIGQNVGACFTAFGNTNTSIAERERSLTFSTSVSIGINIDGGPLTQSEFEMKATMTVAATRSVGSAYELAKTIVFTSAPTEDTVVFTCVPIDRYTYTVLSHPDPTMVGQVVHVDLPRAPITLQAERGFYNASVQPGDQMIDQTVFQHTVGDLATYPDRARKDELLRPRGGLQIGPQSVGQGGGSTEVTLQVGNAVSSGGALSVGFETSFEATGGTVLFGVSVGVETTNTWRVTSGSSTTYTGVIGAIDAANFAANRYQFGLFTYVHRDLNTLQQFQVLNYWLE